MDAAGEHARLVRALTDAFDEAQATLSTADVERVVYIDSGWKVKDLVAHVSAWEAEMLRSLQAYVEGSEYQVDGFTDDDAQNAIFYAQRKDVPFETLQEQWTHTRDTLKSLIANLTDTQLEGEMLFPWHERGKPGSMIGSTVGHQNEHLARIQRAIADDQPDRRAALVETLEASLRDALGALEGIDPERVIYADSGWKVRDLIAHVAAWESEMYRSLATFHQGGSYAIPDYNLEQFNWAVYEARKDWSYSQSVEALKKAREQVKSIAMAMTDRLFSAPLLYPWHDRGEVAYLFNQILWHQNEHMGHILLAASYTVESDMARLVRELDASIHETFDALRGRDKHAVIYEDGGWRVKDIIGHLYTWDSAVGNAVRAYRAGGAHPIPNYPGLDAFNAQQVERYRQTLFSELVDLWLMARTDLLVQVWQMTPEQLAGEMTYASGRRGAAIALIEEVVQHSRDHTADIVRAFNPPPDFLFVEEESEEDT